jgi:hypothetical protein
MAGTENQPASIGLVVLCVPALFFVIREEQKHCERISKSNEFPFVAVTPTQFDRFAQLREIGSVELSQSL